MRVRTHGINRIDDYLYPTMQEKRICKLPVKESQIETKATAAEFQ